MCKKLLVQEERVVPCTKQHADNTFKEGKESGGKSVHFQVERSGKTSWRQWHFVSFFIKNQ